MTFAIIQIAVSHLSRPSAESSKTVPVLSVNFRLGCRVLHSQPPRDASRYTARLPQRGQLTPSGHRRDTRKVRQRSEDEK